MATAAKTGAIPFSERIQQGGWGAALTLGLGAALLHRVILTIWAATIWLAVSPHLDTSVNFHDPGGDLPALATPAEQLAFGVWRRWDAVHYLNLAAYGYRADYPGPTVFGLLAPLGFMVADRLLPGSLDAGAMAFQTLALGLALALLYRVCEVVYRDAALGPWSVAVMALAPMSFLFAAPMSESAYLAAALGLFYFGVRGRWWAAAVCGVVATLARTQGVLLAGVGAVLLLDQCRGQAAAWRVCLRDLVARGWPLLAIPLAALAFTLWRQSLGLPPVSDIYRDSSFVFFVNPLEGLWLNLRYLAEDVSRLVRVPDMTALVLMLALSLLALRFPRHRGPALVAYTVGSILLFVSKVNWAWGTDEVTYSQSLARYAVVLFPLAVLVADGLRHAPPWGRVAGVGLLALSSLAFSALNVLALLGP